MQKNKCIIHFLQLLIHTPNIILYFLIEYINEEGFKSILDEGISVYVEGN